MKSGQTPGALRAPASWSQQQITTVVCSSPQKRAEHWARAATAVYMTSQYENKYVAAHLHGLDSSYKAPSHGALVGHLLDQCYEDVNDKVDARLRAPRFLNFYTDESNNIRKDRVINFLAHTPKGCGTKGRCFYIHSESNGAKTMDAKTQAAWLITQMTQTTEGKLWRVNSLTTDTCNLMHALWKSLKKDPRLEHIFCAPCGSHGIQLLIKDIISVKWYAGVIRRAQLIVRSFRAAHKEYNVLRDLQMTAYGEHQHRSLILHCITRWGTQVGMLGSVLKNEQVLQNYARQGRPKIDQGRKKDAKQVLPVLRDPGFWKDCDTVHQVLAPIHEVQYLSEADNYALHKVVATWMKIRVHLIWMSTEHGIEQAVLPHLVKTVWQTRYEKQTQKIHLQAALLVPASHNAIMIGYTP